MVKCDRCGKETSVTTMSWFNTDVICMACQELEEKHPKYPEAKKAENDQVRSGNYNFDGIGLPGDFPDWAATYTGGEDA